MFLLVLDKVVSFVVIVVVLLIEVEVEKVWVIMKKCFDIVLVGG